MFILTSNGPIKVADLQKLASQLMLNDALMIEMVDSESKKKLWSFDKARNVIIKTKIEIVRAVKNVSTISQDRKGGLVLNLLWKCCIVASFWQVNAFKISLSLWELQVIRNWLCVRDITETSLNRFVTVAFLKKQPPDLLCRKSCFQESTCMLESCTWVVLISPPKRKLKTRKCVFLLCISKKDGKDDNELLFVGWLSDESMARLASKRVH